MEVVAASIVGTLLFSFFNLPTLYQLQIKEYFIPRILAGFRERDRFWIPLRMPAFSPRNILIMLYSVVMTGAYFWAFGRNYEEITFGYIFFWVLGTFVAKISVFLGMLVTEPLAEMKRERLIKKATAKVQASKARFIGVTGSYGKTSVKEFLIRVLMKGFVVEGTKQNYNSEVGLAISVIERLGEDTEVFVGEMAAYQQNTIARSASIINPTIGFVTGLGNQHIALFGGQQRLYDAKAELVEAIPKEGVVYMNMDCEGYDYVKNKAKCKVVTYSIESKAADIYAEILNSLSFKFHYNNYEEVFKVQLVGEHSIQNLLGVIACALDLGIPMDKIKTAVKDLSPLKQRLTVLTNDSGGVLLDDSYNINREGFMSGLKYLASYKNRRKYVLTRGMLEIGNEIKNEYEKISTFCKDNMIQIVTTDKRFLGYSDVVTIIEERRLKDFVSDNLFEDVILLEGRFSPSFMKAIYQQYE